MSSEESEGEDSLDVGTANRDISVPQTEEDIVRIEAVFKSLPTYTPEDGGSVGMEDVPKVLEAVGVKRTPEQIQAYIEHGNKHFDGRMNWNLTVNILKNLHQTDTALKAFAENCDKDGDGFITEDEFADLLALIKSHDPELEKIGISFEDFVKEADKNKDGKVSIEECTQWLRNKMNAE